MSGKSKSQRSKDQARQRADAAAAKRGDDAVEDDEHRY